MRSVDIQTQEEVRATVERSDVCAAPAAAVIGEAVVAIELAAAVLDKFGGDSVRELKRNIESYREACKRW
jgi:chorismate synthase